MNRFALPTLLFALAASCASAPPPRPAPEPVHAAPPPRPVEPNAGPQPMPIDDFKRLIRAVDRSEGGDAGKIALIKAAAADNWFIAGEVGMLIDHVTYRQSKLELVPILNPRITDRSEAWRLVEHFTYREDKAQVQQELTKP